MSQQYEELSNTEKYFIVILLLIYIAALISAFILINHHSTPCKLSDQCGLWQDFLGLAPFYAIMTALNSAIVLSAYYINKLSKKSVQQFRMLTVPPFILLMYFATIMVKNSLKLFQFNKPFCLF